MYEVSIGVMAPWHSILMLNIPINSCFRAVHPIKFIQINIQNKEAMLNLF